MRRSYLLIEDHVNELETELEKWRSIAEEMNFTYGQLEDYCSGLELEIERKNARIAELEAELGRRR